MHEFRSAYTKATKEVQLALGMIVSLLLDELQSDILTFVAARLADYSNRYENIAKITALDLFRTFTKVIYELEIVNDQFSSVITVTAQVILGDSRRFTVESTPRRLRVTTP